MEPGSHPDLFAESIGHSAQRAAQLTSILVAVAQAHVIYRSRRAAIRATQDERTRHALAEQHRLAFEEARLGWAPALDQRWLSQAGITQAARAWGAALTWAEADESAATAMRRAEDRLRTLHPYAMAWYGRLRAEGMAPADAMTEAAPLFARHPRAREGDPARPHPALPAARAEPSRASDPDTAVSPAPAAATGRAGGVMAEAPGGAVSADVVAGRPAADRAAALAAQSFPMTAAEALRAGAAASVAPGQRPQRQAVRQEVVRRRMVM